MYTKIKAGKSLSGVQVALRVFLFMIVGGLIAKLWTDYNTHDPGVTNPEALDYSITDSGNSESNSDDFKKHKK